MSNNFIGERTGKEINISNNSENKHILELGLCGAGKSVRMAGIELERVRAGETVIAIDTNGQHSSVPPKYTNIIDVYKDGIKLNFLSEHADMNRMVEISYIADMITRGQNLGTKQMSSLRQAIDSAMRFRFEYTSDISAIADMLKKQEDAVANSVYSRLWDILEGDFFRSNSKEFQNGMINILSFKGINPSTQRILIEIFMGVLWRKLRVGDASTEKNITLSVDELQNLSMSKNSVLFELLTEARKYNLKLVLATQSISVFDRMQASILNQCSTKLLFKPASNDLGRLLKMMNVNDKDVWIRILKNLKRGQAVAVGTLNCNGRDITDPVITTMSLERLTERRALHE